MCGIIHVKKQGKDNAYKSVIKRYHTQRTRGTEGFGFIAIDNNHIKGIYRAEDEKSIIDMLEKTTCDEIMFHHRFPTSTPNFIEATHPIHVTNTILKYDYYVIHNGIISNCDELKESHDKKGFTFTTAIEKQYHTSQNIYTESMYNDSESFAIDFALAIENETEIQSKGSIAFIALQVEKHTQKIITMFYGRNEGNPLKIEKSLDFFSLSSETGTLIQSDVLYSMDYESKSFFNQDKTIGKYFDYSTSRTGYIYDKSYGAYSDILDDETVGKPAMYYPDDVLSMYDIEDIKSGVYEGYEESIMQDYEDAIDDLYESGDTIGAEKVEKEKNKIARLFSDKGIDMYQWY
jgi:glucosamine 6-phosphate synthetase-like amidotransferase/phosphosugar isomerase protein